MNIKFENRFEKSITQQQASDSVNFYKVFEDSNGQIKKKEEYQSNEIVKILYYLGVNETEQQVLSNILSQYNYLINGIEIRSKDLINNFTKETRNFFSQTGLFENFTVELLFEQGKLICEKEKNNISGLLVITTRKFYLDTVNNVEYEFLYDSNGALLAMKGVNPPFVAENDYSLDVNEVNYFFPSFLANNPYYQNDSLIPLRIL